MAAKQAAELSSKCIRLNHCSSIQILQASTAIERRQWYLLWSAAVGWWWTQHQVTR